MLNKIKKINQSLDKKFPNSNNPFQIITRLAEEIQDVLRCAMQVCSYYKADAELEQSINQAFEKMQNEGLI